MEKQYSSGQIYQDFQHWQIFTRSRKNWRRTLSQKTSRTGWSEASSKISCQCSMTLYGKRMMRIVFRTPKKSRITHWDFRKEVGHWKVQDRKRDGMEVLTTLKKGNGIVQPKNVQRFKETGQLVCKSISAFCRRILKQKNLEKHPFTSTEIRWTQNSCSKRITQFFSSVCTEQWRIGDINSVRQKKRRVELVCCGHQHFDQVETGRSTTLGSSSDTSNWKQDARKRPELRRAGW